MATQLLDTEHGAALLADALRKPYWNTHDQKFVAMLLNPEPWPHMVYYRAGRVLYVKPEEFCTMPRRGVSDCEWIVPRTLPRS